MNKILSVTVVLSIVIAVAGGFWFVYQAEQSAIPKIDGIVLHPPRQIKDFTFKDHELKDFSTASLLGKWHLMFFGYTHCPDVCTPTLNTLNIAYEKMSDSEREMTSVVFVSVDPLRDTPEALSEYMNQFNDDFIGVTTTDEALKDFTQQLGVAYAKAETIKYGSAEDQQDIGGGNYLIGHTARILMFNPRAELQAYLRPPSSPQSLLDSVRKTQRFYNNIQSGK